MSRQKRSLDDLEGMRQRLVQDLGESARTARSVWQTMVAPQLAQLGRQARVSGGKATAQAGEIFSEVGRRLRSAGDKLING